ncbi:Clavaminate synthase-like protein [Sparassis latifolia]|uniref:JmjC domain-containing protein n=1 Tax=Sparassis crispa TaxID=139825 RepID=A0A401GBB6_9APHY|nr:predicted protein [Sparassis crispa]GBE79449.1 predicted protein [Sparassis crispa]
MAQDDSSSGAAVDRSTLRWISNEYYELNGLHFDVLHSPPTPLEFSRLVHIGRPVLIKNCEFSEDLSRWSDEYLVRKLGDGNISVAVTPNGRADAITAGPDGRLYFAEPHVQRMSMSAFLASLSSDSDQPQGPEQEEICYLQSQNGNLYTACYFNLSGDPDPSEFEPLREDVPSEIPWCSDALEKSPDAVNLWIGDSRSITSIHSDPYENIYTVVRGAKHFTLLPPTEGWCLEERTYPHAQYIRSPKTSPKTSELVLSPSPSTAVPIRWSSVVDPNLPGALPAEAHPIQISVQAGDALYLPAGWWHYVRQSSVTIALNYWYDLESRGMSWVWLNFLRGLGEPPSGNVEGKGVDS